MEHAQDTAVPTSDAVASGKGHRDENFPVASHLIAARHRPAIMAFYDFVRAADDVADNAVLAPQEKLGTLDRMEASLLGRSEAEPVALPLRAVLAERHLTPRHAQDLLDAFRLDVTKPRTATLAELMHYCSLSAMPVGRYVLDVHGEPNTTWPASDAICAALQIINHLQDCAKDLADLDRVYIPLDALGSAGLSVEALREPRSSPELREVFRYLARRTDALLDEGERLPAAIRDPRLAMEIATILGLARRLVALLKARDPLSERVHLGKGTMLAVTARAALGTALDRLVRRGPTLAGLVAWTGRARR